MKLLTKDILTHIPRIGETSEKDASEVRVWVKFFLPEGAWTWYVTELDPDTEEAFGFVRGFGGELGYFSLTELRELRTPTFHLPIERDLYWNNKTTLREVMDGTKR